VRAPVEYFDILLQGNTVILSGPGAQPIVAPVTAQNSELVSMYVLFFFCLIQNTCFRRTLLSTSAAKVEDF
jgi:hypothetical protein